MYLSKIIIENYKGIKQLELDFDPSINIIIGENGSWKSAVIDAIRLLYNLGEPIRQISVSKEDFHKKISIQEDQLKIETTKKISIIYEFRGLSEHQNGAFYEYMVISENGGGDFAKIVIYYEDKGLKYPQFSYNTGNIEGQKADPKTFELFQHYYLGALRDSTRDLLTTRGNILGRVIKRLVDRGETEEQIEEIIKEANERLLERDEVIQTRNNVNDNLSHIFKHYIDNKIGLQIEQAKADYIVNAIKPFLPHDKKSLKDEGFNLWQNSLGFNNLIYIATVLGDINEQIEDNKIPHYALLIEEPEAHLHPQLQLSLYNFLKEANQSENSQLFITTHSPTLTSKVPFNSLILLDKKGYRLSTIFSRREQENIVENTSQNVPLKTEDFMLRRKKLERYIDVTKSQLFYAKAILFVEGISEEMLITAFAKIEGFQLEDYRIELVNVGGTSFYPFIYLFNSVNSNLRIPKSVTLLTDDDRFPQSKHADFSFDNLIKNEYEKLIELDNNLLSHAPSTRIKNLVSVINNAPNLLIKSAYKTLEFELTLHNINDDRMKLSDNFLFAYLQKNYSGKIDKIIEYTKTFSQDNMSEEQKRKVAILLWKSLPSKTEFSQNFSIHLLNHLEYAKKSFNIPPYIKDGLTHLKKNDGI